MSRERSRRCSSIRRRLPRTSTTGRGTRTHYDGPIRRDDPAQQHSARTTAPDAGLADLARRIRVGALVAVYHAGSGHPGGSLSAADVLAYLWSRELDYAPDGVRDADGNRFVLSKGHCCPALYAAAAEAGVLRHSDLYRLRKLGSPLQGHPHVVDLPWVETSTGSLGQGFSFSVGLSLGLDRRGSGAHVFVMLGDGELQEGEVWEAAMFAGHCRLDRLVAIVDYNKMQSDDLNENIVGLEPLRAKWEAFNWSVQEIDGHDFGEIGAAVDAAKAERGRPSVIIAHTVKGEGVSYMEGSPLWHGSVKLKDEELELALGELGVEPAEIERHLHATLWAGTVGS